MIIQVRQPWPDGAVYRVNPKAKEAIIKRTEELFTPEEIKELKEMAREFEEECGLIFADELKKGWISACLEEGTFSRISNGEPLQTWEEVIKELSQGKRQIEFHVNSGRTAEFLSQLIEKEK